MIRIRFVVLGLLAAGVLATGLGCASLDPTEQAFAISFQNDLGRPATLKTCGDQSCTSFPDTWKLTAGQTVQDNISDRGVVTRWLVVNSGGGRRCLPLVFDAKYRGVVVKLSQAEECPGKPLPLDELKHGAKLGGQT